jgi:5''-3'' exonuclease (including N-terminal domain of PolI)
LYNADHVVFALEGRSWRKDVYAPYKANRKVAAMAKTEAEQEEDQLFMEALNDMTTYLREKTNCSVVRCPNAEADDIIARFIQTHPNDEHIIVSTDSDFYQLIAENVSQYNGVTEELITINGFYKANGKEVIDKKTKLHKKLEDPQWLLFEKCIRGDSTDNVFSAYPGVRKKGTKNKTGMIDAFADKDTKGFNWNNLMLQRWTDHNGDEHLVNDDYQRNRTLIDLTAQPSNVVAMLDKVINEQCVEKAVPMIGAHFMKFCGKYELVRMSESANAYVQWLTAPYKQ